MKKTFLFLLLLLFPLLMQAQYNVMSPDSRIRVSLQSVWVRKYNSKMMRKERMYMDVSVEGRRVVRRKEISMTVKSHGHRHSFGKADVTAYDAAPRTLATFDATDSCLTSIGNRYNRAVLHTSAGILLEIRVFNEGVAYRFSVEGYPDEYKVLDISAVFPDEKANAIVGTFSGDIVFPWRTMNLDEGRIEKKEGPDEWDLTYPSNKIVTKRDALSSVSIGSGFSWIQGSQWHDVNESNSVYADFIYKNLYTGLSFSPCQQSMYIFYERDFPPFDKVIGRIYMRDVSARIGYNLPVQNGSDVWHFSPYATATYMNLHQHGKTRIGFKDVEKNDHFLVGLGMKVQFMMRERASLGVGYEYQWFLGSQRPTGRHTLLFSIGYCL